MLSGTVRFYNRDKGYGFILPDDGGSEVFVHVSSIELAGLETLRTGDRVSFRTRLDREGRNAAIELRPASASC